MNQSNIGEACPVRFTDKRWGGRLYGFDRVDRGRQGDIQTFKV
jgi:hypothetical protein